MLRGIRWAMPTLCVLLPAVAGAQDCGPPVVRYYPPPAPVVTYYAAPAPVSVSVSTYRYGLFRRRSVTIVNYAAPVPAVAAPAPPPAVSSYYYPPPPVVAPPCYGPVFRRP